MSIVKHTPGYRRIWMFPRNIRRIEPWKLMQIISLLKQQTDYSNWNGNQSLQNQFMTALDQASLKRPTNIRDPQSGGARTYIAQLECLGLVYKKDKSLELTLAGEDMQNAAAPLKVLQTMLLRHQYPSSYGSSRGVRIHPEIKVKPFLFILMLLNDPAVEYLTNDELMIPVIYGHNFDCFDLCKEKILQFREHNDFLSVIDNPDEDLYTPKGTPENALSNIHDIANTCKNYLQSACLASVCKQGKTEVITSSDDIQTIISEELKQKVSYLRNPLDTESFQRSYGEWNRQKDNRAKPATRSISRGENIILSSFMEYCGNNMVLENLSGFVDDIKAKFGFPEDLIMEVIEPYITRTLSIFESKYLQLSTSGAKDATEFEKTTGELFEKRLGFAVDHTGQKHRSKGTGGYSDLYLIEKTGTYCAVIDTKASPSYTLPSNDFYKLISNYIPNYRELGNEKLEFCSYIAGGFHGGIENRLQEAQKETNIPVSALTAKTLIGLCSKEEITNDQKRVRKGMAQSKKLRIQDF